MSIETQAAPTILFVHPLAHQGQRLLGSRWSEFLQLFRTHLRQSGIENQESDTELLIFSFHHPYAAVACLLDGFAQLKKEMAWQPAQGALPVQVVLHLAQPEEHLSELAPLSPGLWTSLRQESLYLTNKLRLQWKRLMAGRRLVDCSFEPTDQGLFLLAFEDQGLIKIERLFPDRELPLLGKHRECFYCGMTHHEPAFCPSKLLGSRQQGLPLAGYLPVAELNRLYRAALADHKELVNYLITGIKTSHIRQNAQLQVFLAYFDLTRIYQLRFLHQIAFSFFSSWNPHLQEENTRITNRNLHLGLDCLRVGQYGQAEQIFVEEASRHKGNHFCARVGQAFSALEQGRPRDMEEFLEKAASQAGQEKEQIYLGLLLSRFHDLQGDRWKADHAVDSILSLNRSCPEARYRKCQLQARVGAGAQAYQQLGDLIDGSREMFMTVLMDPMLVPIQGLVEDLLAANHRGAVQNAGENLERAAADCAELRNWFKKDETSEELEDLVSNLAALESQYARQSYYDLLDVAVQAERLSCQSNRLREARIDQFKERIREVTLRWDGYHSHWRAYPYPLLFKRFGETLGTSRKKLEEARELSQQVVGEAYVAALAKVEETEADLDGLAPLLTRMAWISLAFDGFRVFARKLIITEIMLIILGVMLFFLFNSYLAGRIPAIPQQVLSEPWFLKQAVSVVTLLLAPVLALALTLWEINDR